MAGSPEFTVEWGGSWTRSSRARTRELAESIVGFAAGFAQDQSIEVREPKRFQFCRRRPNTKFAGLCEDPQKVSIAVNRREVARGTVSNGYTFDVMEAGVHEAVHALRFERFPVKNHDYADFAEHAVQEGLAYTSGLLAFRPKGGSASFLELAQRIYRLDARISRAVRVENPRRVRHVTPVQFSAAVNHLLSSTGDPNHFSYWRSARSNENDLSESIGILGVAKLLDEGCAFADLLDAPAEQVLRLATEAIGDEL